MFLYFFKRENGFEALATETCNYSHNDTYRSMEDSLCDAAEDEILSLVSKSSYIGIMVDESIDVAINKNHIIYLKIVDRDQAKVLFAGSLTVKDGKANAITEAILDFMKAKNIPF